MKLRARVSKKATFMVGDCRRFFVCNILCLYGESISLKSIYIYIYIINLNSKIILRKIR